MPEIDLETLRRRMAGLFPELLGISIVEATPDLIRGELTVREELCTVPGIMHGGAIMAFADTLGAVGTVFNLPPGAATTTVESKTNFFAAAPTGTVLTGECTPLHRGRRTMVWQTRMLLPGDKLVAMVTQTQMVLEPRS